MLNSDVFFLPQLRNAGLSCRFVRMDMSSSFRKGCVRKDVYPVPELEGLSFRFFTKNIISLFRTVCVCKDVYVMPKLMNAPLASRYCNWNGEQTLANASIQYKCLTTSKIKGHCMTSPIANWFAFALLHKALVIRTQRFRNMRSYVKQRLRRHACARQEKWTSVRALSLRRCHI